MVLSAGDSLVVEDLDLADCDRAALGFSRSGGGSSSSALLVSE